MDSDLLIMGMTMVMGIAAALCGLVIGCAASDTGLAQTGAGGPPANGAMMPMSGGGGTPGPVAQVAAMTRGESVDANAAPALPIPTADMRSPADARAPIDFSTGRDVLSAERLLDAGPPVLLGGDMPPLGWRQAMVGVGYAGVRIRSLDLGETWPDVQRLAPTGGDDQNLLRCVAWGRGLFITGGWQYFTSPDGVAWTKRANPAGCGLMQGCAYGNGKFVATCGGTSYVSSDGVAWTRGGAVDTGGHPNLLFGAGAFAVWGDAHRVFGSKDGAAWSLEAGLGSAGFCNDKLQERAACGDADWGFGVGLKGWFQQMGGGGIFRATDLKTWRKVAPIGGVERFTFGYVPN